MRIKKRLQISSAVSVSIALIVFLLFVFLLLRISRANNAAVIAGDIITASLERLTLRNDYIRNNNARAKEQWFVKHDQLGRVLRAASEAFPEPADEETISELIKNHEAIGKVFSAVVSNREGRNPALSSAGVEDRLISQLNMRVYDSVIRSRKLLESSRQTRASVIRRSGAGMIGLLLVLIAVSVLSSLSMGRAVTDRVRSLSEGASLIGGGDLTHRIHVDGDDEFAELAERFNEMTVKMQASYQRLEQEVQERRLAEERSSHMASFPLLNPNPVLETDGAGGVTFANPATEKILAGMGLSGSDASVFLPADLGDVLRGWDRQGDMTYEREVDVQGRVFRESISLSSRFGVVRVYAYEITERKRAEEEIIKLSEDMAARNVELESANRELESFVYSVSHDLRAPLRSISGFTRIIMNDYAGKFDAQGRDYLGRVVRGTEKMSQLIDAMLNLSRISRQDMAPARVDLSALAASVAAELREAHPGREVDVEIAPGISAMADPPLMELVLSNLLENAWKFTAKTEGARIEFGSMTGEGDDIDRISHGGPIYFVRDNGAGFDMAYADKMFLPFHRLHPATEYEGGGVGLSIVERIIRRHGGRVWAEGSPGGGAVVYFTLG